MGYAVQLHRAREQFEQAGVRLVLIGQLTPRHAAHFRRRHGVDLPILTDAPRASYKAAGARKASVNELLGPKVIARGALTSLRTGKVQTRVIGDPAQLGGAMVIDADGTVIWSRMSKDASDNAPPEEILAAIRK